MSLDDLIFESPPLEWVVTASGVDLERDDNKLIGLCPFHEDSDPSFAVWRYNDRDFCGCWACGFGPTDGIGFIRRMHGVAFSESLVILRRIAKQMPEDFRIVELASTSVRDGARDYSPEVEKALTNDPAAAREFLELRGLGEHDEWLMERYGFGGDHKYIVVPHYTPSGRHVTGIKYRELGGDLLSMGGATLSFLYGCQNDEGQPFVVICEGESDTWRVACFFRNDPRVLVLGMPSGAKGPKAQWLRVLEGRKLLLILDQDDTGRRVAAEWREARPDARILFPPNENDDASDLSDPDLEELLATG